MKNVNQEEDEVEDDEIVAEVRAIRAKILEECDYDIQKVAERARNIKLPPGMRRISSPLEIPRQAQDTKQSGNSASE